MSKCKGTRLLSSAKQIFLTVQLRLKKTSCLYSHYSIGNIILLAIDYIQMQRLMQVIHNFRINLSASNGVSKKFNYYNGVYSLMPCKNNSILKISRNKIGKMQQSLFHEKILHLVRVNGCICNIDHHRNFNGI